MNRPKHTLSLSLCIGALGSGLITPPTQAESLPPRLAEDLGRSLVAMSRVDGSVFLSWRLLPRDTAGTTFNLYRMDEGQRLINPVPISDTTTFIDTNPGAAPRYALAVVNEGVEGPLQPIIEIGNRGNAPYISLPLNGDYIPRKVAVADLNGDGEYDYVIKQPNTNIDPAPSNWMPSEDTYKIEAYLRDGTFLWRQDLGWGVEQGIWYSPYLSYDLDGDGRAEVIAKTVFGSPGPSGHVTRGDERVTVWDGMTGEFRAEDSWVPKSPQIYNWNSRNQLGLAYLDGETPSILVARGTYCYMTVEAHDLVGGTLQSRWYWDSVDESSRPTTPVKTLSACGFHYLGAIAPFDWYLGQGAHTMHAVDVDGDGLDEVILGSASLDDDGTGLWTTGMGHSDHTYVGDILPSRPGLEMYLGYEVAHERGGAQLIDPETAEVIWQLDEPTDHLHSSGLCSDIDPNHPGMECYSGEQDYPERYLFSASGEVLAREGEFDVSWRPKGAYWDGSPQRAVLHNKRLFNYITGETYLNLSGNAIGWADVLGDWREEIIVAVEGELRIYVTTLPTTSRRVTMMADPIYRIDVAHQSMGYHQVPTTSYWVAGQDTP